MANQLESALVIALRDTIRWESSSEAPANGTLTPVNPDLPFDARTYQERDRQLAYRDLMVGAAVVEVAVQVGDVWNFSVPKPALQGPAPFSLPFVSTEAGTYSSQIRHVTNVSIPYDAARYADADLYGRDALVYEVLARACESTFDDPSIPRIDAAGTLIPDTAVWSLGQGTPSQSDICTVLPLNRDLFKKPDQNLADRDNQLAGYVSRLAQELRNPFEHALRLYVQVEAYGTVQREPDIYALTSDDGARRVFQTEPALPGANQIIYDVGARTLQWVRERVDETHVPQIYAMTVPGIEAGQTVETLARVPDRKDAQYWRGKAGQLSPEGIQLSDTGMWLARTDNDSVSGGVVQCGSASFTVPDTMTFSLSGSLAQTAYRVSVLAKPNSRVEIAGAQNISNTTGTLGGATFDINVPSGGITDKVYMVEGGDGIVYNGSTYLEGDVFAGTSAVSTYVQNGIVDSTVRQRAVNFRLGLPAGPWSVQIEYTNISGSNDMFGIKGDYIAAGSVSVPVVQDITPVPFVTSNGNVVTTAPAGMDVTDTNPFSFTVQWTSGGGQLHIRKLIFASETEQGRFAASGTLANSVSYVDVDCEDGVPGVLRFHHLSRGSNSGTTSFALKFTGEASLPVQIQQVQVQTMGTYATTPLSRGFQGWRQECLGRAERTVQQSYASAVAAYGADIPTFRDAGSVWTRDCSESWMSFAEVYHPRLRRIDNIQPDSITPGFQYEVTTPSVTYDGTVYTEGQKFYGVEASGTVYTGGTVSQEGAFILSGPGHIGKPCLVPRGLYFDDTDRTVKAHYDTPLSTPTLMACQPWMVEAGLYVAHEDFWTPETLGLTLPTDPIPVPDAFFVGTPTSGDFPLSVSFLNLSTGGSSFFWDFGD